MTALQDLELAVLGEGVAIYEDPCLPPTLTRLALDCHLMNNMPQQVGRMSLLLCSTASWLQHCFRPALPNVHASK